MSEKDPFTLPVRLKRFLTEEPDLQKVIEWRLAGLKAAHTAMAEVPPRLATFLGSYRSNIVANVVMALSYRKPWMVAEHLNIALLAAENDLATAIQFTKEHYAIANSDPAAMAAPIETIRRGVWDCYINNRVDRINKKR